MAFLAEEGFTVTAWTGRATAFKNAFSLTKRRRVLAQADPKDISELDAMPFADCILDICTLQHLPDADAAAIIAKARGWLKPGGRFFSVMLDDSEGYTFPAPVYPRADRDRWTASFGGYVCLIGQQMSTEPTAPDWPTGSSRRR
jgi:SAM-dependent methyltransferase